MGVHSIFLIFIYMEKVVPASQPPAGRGRNAQKESRARKDGSLAPGNQGDRFLPTNCQYPLIIRTHLLERIQIG